MITQSMLEKMVKEMEIIHLDDIEGQRKFNESNGQHKWLRIPHIYAKNNISFKE